MAKDKSFYVEIDEDESQNGKIILPSDYEKKPRRKKDIPILSKKEKKKFKFWFIVSILVLLYIFYDKIIYTFFDLLKSNPTVYKIYLGIEYEIINNTLKGLFMVSILGSLFFLAFPSEAIFIFYLDSTTIPFFIVISILILGNAVGLIFNYLFGRILGERFIQFLFKKNFERYKEKIDKWGGIVLLIGNIFPGPIELLSIFYGAFKYQFSKYLYLCMMGRFIKYVILFFLYITFWDQITFYYDGILTYLTNLKFS